MVSRNLSNGLEVKSITYTMQREKVVKGVAIKGSVHTVQVDPVDLAMTCDCTAGVYGRECWAQKAVRAQEAPKPVIRATVRPAVRRARTSAEGRDFISQLDV